MHKKDMGKMGEALVTAQVLLNGCAVFTEYGDNAKIDLIVLDQQQRLHKVQVKTVGREANVSETSKLYLYKSGPNGYRYTYTAADVDWFALVDLTTMQIAWVSIGEALLNGTCFALRHTATKSGQTKNVRMFSDYMKFPFSP
jgi:hypothetical protein